MNKTVQTQKNKRFDKGFTLIEIMVAVSIFAIVMTVGVGSLITINNAHKLSRAQRQAVDSVGFLLDSLAREMYTGSSFVCGSSSTGCYPNGRDNITFLNQYGCSISIKQVDNDILRRIENPNNRVECSERDWENLTSNDNISIENLTFRVRGTKRTNNDAVQPLIVITVNGSVVAGSQVQPISMQTSVSQRLLDTADGE